MPVSLEQSDSQSILRLQGAVDISCAAALRQLLLEALASPHPVTVSVADLTEADVTAVQLLWLAQREAQARGAAFAFSGRLAENLRISLRQAGWADWLATVDPDWRNP